MAARCSICDGLAISGATLYVAVNARNLVVVVELSADGSSGGVDRLHGCEAFAFPTAISMRGDQLLVVNAQLDIMSGRPSLPFTVVATDVTEV